MALLKGLFGGLKKGLTRTRETFTTSLRSLLHGRTVDDALIKELEAKLIQADLGLEAVNTLMERVRKESRAGTLTEGDQVIIDTDASGLTVRVARAAQSETKPSGTASVPPVRRWLRGFARRPACRRSRPWRRTAGRARPTASSR